MPNNYKTISTAFETWLQSVIQLLINATFIIIMLITNIIGLKGTKKKKKAELLMKTPMPLTPSSATK